MDKTEQTVRKTLAAVDAPCYDIGILTDQGMFPRMDALTASQCMNRLRYLKYRNAHGAHIYFRPSGERRFTLLDDLNQTAISTLTAEGFEPCAIIETSPGNYQAWLKHTHVLPKHSVRLPLRLSRIASEPILAQPTGGGLVVSPASPTESHSTGTQMGFIRSSGFTARPGSSSPTPTPFRTKLSACIDLARWND